jgi:hypothetical protein
MLSRKGRWVSWIFALTVGAQTWAARWQDTDREKAPELIDLARKDQQGAEADGPRPMPSAVWTDGTTTLTAEEALVRAKSAPDGLIADPSSLLGADPVRRGDKRIEPVDLMAAVLTEAYARATAATESEPAEILLTHPDGWSGEQVSALRQAAYRAKLSVDPVVEGVAAASAYAAWGGPGTRVLVVDADRRSAAAVARVNRVFVVLTTARDMSDRPVRRMAEEVLDRPGVRRELLNDIIVVGTEPAPELVTSLTDLTDRSPSELTREAVALGALHYHRALTPTTPAPLVAPPPPPPPPPTPGPKVNHYAPVKRKMPLVPLLILILIVLVILELLFVYWPF